jgi:hypothetical protein
MRNTEGIRRFHDWTAHFSIESGEETAPPYTAGRPGSCRRRIDIFQFVAKPRTGSRMLLLWVDMTGDVP